MRRMILTLWMWKRISLDSNSRAAGKPLPVIPDTEGGAMPWDGCWVLTLKRFQMWI